MIERAAFQAACQHFSAPPLSGRLLFQPVSLPGDRATPCKRALIREDNLPRNDPYEGETGPLSPPIADMLRAKIDRSGRSEKLTGRLSDVACPRTYKRVALVLLDGVPDPADRPPEGEEGDRPARR